MRWSKSEQVEIIEIVEKQFQLADLALQNNGGIYAVIWFCDIGRFKPLTKKRIDSSGKKRIPLLESFERGKVWAGAYLRDGIVTFETYDLRQENVDHGIPYALFETIMLTLIAKYPESN